MKILIKCKNIQEPEIVESLGSDSSGLFQRVRYEDGSTGAIPKKNIEYKRVILPWWVWAIITGSVVALATLISQLWY